MEESGCSVERGANGFVTLDRDMDCRKMKAPTIGPAVVLVPGIGLGGTELLWLAGRLRGKGYRVRIFWWNPWRRTLNRSSEELHRTLSAIDSPEIYLIAHSLGGLVSLRTLQDHPDARVRRMVALGSPLNGCVAARRVLRCPGGRWLLGEAATSIAFGTKLSVPEGCEVGSIAGAFNLLFGFLLCPRRRNDTLICVEETRHEALTDHCTLWVSHTSMLLSTRVSDQIVSFLRTGRFIRR